MTRGPRVWLCSLLTVLVLGGCSRGPEVIPTQEHRSDPGLHETIASHLRAGGQPTLDRLIAEYRSEPARLEAEDRAWRALIDAVAGQRDAHYGGMFWHTDLEAALVQAEATHKPVLSLRMLGELTSEYSCANSRLFRTLLYADAELAGWLKENFVLHWSSERPVPRVQIDFGDGRVVERTITGNSAHFVLDSRGRTLDVIPGLWSAEAFQAALAQSLALHAKLDGVHERRFRGELAIHHEAAFAAAAARLADELGRVRGEPQNLAAVKAWLRDSPDAAARVPARKAVPMAIGKAKIEAPILASAPGALGGGGGDLDPPLHAVGPRDDLERLAIGTSVAFEAALHSNSLAIIATEHPLANLVPADQLDVATAAMLDALLASLRQDTAKNALELRPRVHAELAARARKGVSLGFDDVDAWVYASLFETPAADPWLGLVDPTVYTGLEDGGIAIDRDGAAQ